MCDSLSEYKCDVCGEPATSATRDGGDIETDNAGTWKEMKAEFLKAWKFWCDEHVSPGFGD